MRMGMQLPAALGRSLRSGLAGLSLLVAGNAAHAEPTELASSVQVSLSNLAMMVMQHEKMVEKWARQDGMGEIKMNWIMLGAEEAINDALLSGSIQFAAGGVPPFLTMWDKTRNNFAIRGIGPYANIKMSLLVRGPRIKSLEDFTPNDRIAVPGVQASSQAVLLEIQSEKVFGPGQARKLDPLTVTRSHADAAIAFLSGNSELTAHFSASPFVERELEDPTVRVLFTSRDVYGARATNGVIYATGKFCDANPKSCRAYLQALQEAEALIAADKRKAAQIFLDITNFKDSVEHIQQILEEPDMNYDPTPIGIMITAGFMHRIGTIKQKPESWKDLFFPAIHDRSGS